MEERSSYFPLHVGPFEIVGLLGQGGMGVVYSARLPGASDRVAVKTVPDAQEGLLSSMRREIHALRRLSHPGVVRIFESGVDGGRPWYAMELLSGPTLSALRSALWDPNRPLEQHLAVDNVTAPMAARPRSEQLALRVPAAAQPPARGQLARVLTVMRRLLDTLAFVHGEGIVHRDLKPENVFLRDADQPVLVDFGTASCSAESMGREVLDLSLDRVGTPAYMAPEQIFGDAVDSRCDLYAVGCIFYELLTGRPPFTGNLTMVMHQHLKATPRPPSELTAACPRELDGLVLALLEKRPCDRIGHAAEVVDALDALGARDALGVRLEPPRQIRIHAAEVALESEA